MGPTRSLPLPVVTTIARGYPINADKATHNVI